MYRKRYLLIVSLPNHFEIGAANLYSDMIFVTLIIGQYLVLSS